MNIAPSINAQGEILKIHDVFASYVHDFGEVLQVMARSLTPHDCLCARHALSEKHVGGPHCLQKVESKLMSKKLVGPLRSSTSNILCLDGTNSLI
jgi:hypothetical protein